MVKKENIVAVVAAWQVVCELYPLLCLPVMVAIFAWFARNEHKGTC